MKSLSGRWDFALKKHENNEIVNYEARNAARSFIRNFDSDYLEFFASTAELFPFPRLLALTTHFRSGVFYFDVG